MVVDENTNLEETEEVVPSTGNEESGDVGTQANTNPDEGKVESKTFTQEDVNNLLKKEREKFKKNELSKEDKKAFSEWKESQKTAEQKQVEKETEYQKALSDLQDKENTIAVLKSGCLPEYQDFVQYTVSKMDGDFEENLEEYLKSNPKYTKMAQQNVNSTNTTGMPVKTPQNSKTSGVDAYLKHRHPDLFK